MLKVMLFNINSLVSFVLLDTGPVPNFISADTVKQFNLALNSKPMTITVPDGSNALYMGRARSVLIIFGIQVDFPTVKNAPLGMIMQYQSSHK